MNRKCEIPQSCINCFKHCAILVPSKPQEGPGEGSVQKPPSSLARALVKSPGRPWGEAASQPETAGVQLARALPVPCPGPPAAHTAADTQPLMQGLLISSPRLTHVLPGLLGVCLPASVRHSLILSKDVFHSRLLRVL